jgi:predicted DNA-binding transcriptional regulator YafY
MRADRLLQVAALLRQHGRLSAPELARRLEVTPRTIARDVEALSAAGVPVYAERGRSGGYALIPGYRPDAESLGVDEAGALFVAGGAQVAADLGLGNEFARALRKLASGMPSAHLDRVGGLLDRLVIDPGGWGSAAVRTPSALAVVFAAVQADQRLLVSYRPRGAARGTERRLDPWGLVLAAGTWYLVAGDRGSDRAYRVDRIEQVQLLDEPTERPERLDVLALWHELRAGWRAGAAYPVVLSVTRAQADLVRRSLGLVLTDEPEVLDDGGDRIEIRARVSTLRGAVGVLLGFGSWVHVLDPPELRELMVQIADEARSLYAVPDPGA